MPSPSQQHMQKSLQDIKKILKVFYAELAQLKKQQRMLIAEFSEKISKRQIEKIKKQLE